MHLPAAQAWFLEGRVADDAIASVWPACKRATMWFVCLSEYVNQWKA